ncbi:MAG: hypothetical protein RIM99_11420 [Cyclobacteriaceae bacterium]
MKSHNKIAIIIAGVLIALLLIFYSYKERSVNLVGERNHKSGIPSLKMEMDLFKKLKL